MAETAVRETDRGTVKKDQQRLINAVEKRLSLPGGTLLAEIAQDLVNRLGKSSAMLEQAKNIIENARGFVDKNGQPNKVAGDKMRIDGRKLKAAGEDLAKKERAEYMKEALAYINKTYGDENKNEHNRVVGYGDRIEVNEKRHLHKIW